MSFGYKGAGCLVFHYNESTHKVSVLLGKRRTGAGAGQWSIPGGGWETKDGYTKSGKINYRKTASRELGEELLIHLPKDYKLNKIWSAHYLFFDFEVFAVRRRTTAPLRKWTEFSRVEWFDIEKLPKNLYWMVPGQIDNLLKAMTEKGYNINYKELAK